MKNLLHRMLRSGAFYMGLLYFFVLFLSLYRVWSINLFPTKYILLFLVCGLLIYLIILRLITWNRRSTKLIGYLLQILVVSLCFWITVQISGVDNFLDRQSPITRRKELKIAVLKDSPYHSIEDLKKKKLALPLKTDESSATKLRQNLEQEHPDVVPFYENVNTYVDGVNALLDKKADAVMLNTDFNDMVLTAVPGYLDKIRIIYTMNSEQEIKLEHDIEDITQEPFNIYLSGNDEFGELTEEGRTDTNIIATVNPKTRQVLLTSIPRDYYVRMAIGDPNAYDKLTHSSNFGVETTVKTLEDLLDTKISYYVRINFSSLIEIVNAIGGIDIDNPTAFNTFDIKEMPFDFPVGKQHLNGLQALAYSRERYFFGDERTRGTNQQRVISAIIAQITKPENIINFGSILDSLGDIYQTNMTPNEISALIRMQLNDNKPWTIQDFNLNGADAMGHYSYMMPAYNLYVMMPYAETVEYASDCIAKLLRGESVKIDRDKENPADPTILNQNTRIRRSESQPDESTSGNEVTTPGDGIPGGTVTPQPAPKPKKKGRNIAPSGVTPGTPDNTVAPAEPGTADRPGTEKTEKPPLEGPPVIIEPAPKADKTGGNPSKAAPSKPGRDKTSPAQ